MRNTILVFLAFSVATPSLAAPPGTAQNFLDRANRLKAKGPLAFFDSDYGRLKAEATAFRQTLVAMLTLLPIAGYFFLTGRAARGASRGCASPRRSRASDSVS